MISRLASFLNNPPRYAGVTVTIIILVTLIAIGSFCLLLENKNKGAGIMLLSLLVILVCAFTVFFSSNITYGLEKTNLQTKLSSEMKSIDNEYPYQLSIANNKNVYFVFCKTKDDQKKVIKTMNTGNNPAIKFSGQTATYANLPQQIHNGIQVENKVEEKDLLLIVKEKFEEF